MDQIYTLEELYYKLNNNFNHTQFNDLAIYINKYCGNDWTKYLSFKNFNNQIKLNDYSNSEFEMLLVYWTPNQYSKLYDHSNNGCIMKVLDGTIIENLYDYNFSLQNSTQINKNYVSVINYHLGLHQMYTQTYSITLHIYTIPPHYYP